MPSDAEYLKSAEEWKIKGNESFGKSNWDDAIQSYSQGIVQLDRLVGTLSAEASTLKATTLSNRSTCYLKNAKSLEELQSCIDDCTTALQVMGGITTDTAALRAKVLFKRSKATFLQANWPTIAANGLEQNDKLQEAAKDLLTLLNFDAKNKEATKLLQTIRNQHAIAQKTNQISSTPLGKTLQNMQQLDDKTLHHTKVLLGMLSNDAISATMELGRLNGVNVLLNVLQKTAKMDKADKVQGLALQALATAASHPPFCRQYLAEPEIQVTLSKLIVFCCNTLQQNPGDVGQEDRAISALAVYLRLILHLDRDVEPDGDIKSDSKLLMEPLMDAYISVLQSKNLKLIRATVDLLSTWIAGRDRESVIRASLDTVTAKNDLPKLATQAEIRQMTPKEMSTYKKRRYDKTLRDEKVAYDRSLHFCSKESEGLNSLLNCITSTEDRNVRHELTVALAKMVGAQIRKAKEDDDIESVENFIGKTYLGFTGKVINPKKKAEMEAAKRKKAEQAKMGVVIEELDEDNNEENGKVTTVEEDKKDDDDDGNVTKKSSGPVTLETMMRRTALATAILMVHNEVGAWTIGSGWPTCRDELSQMVDSDNKVAACLVAECMTSAASVNETRAYAATMLTPERVKALVGHQDRDIRTAAATAITKVGLAEKTADDVEMMGLLEAACYMLEDIEDDVGESSNGKKKKEVKVDSEKLPESAAKATTGVERGVETMLYLVSKTFIKEEVAAGFQATPESKHSGLELLVKFAETPGAGESLSAFGVASIFHHLSVTHLTLRQEAFEGKEMSMEQYDEIQKMQKTEEEKDMLEKQEEEWKDDPQENCVERIRKLTSANVPHALVQLIEGASERALEQIVLALSRMATVESVRGTMIQQGVLSALIRLDKEEKTPTDTKKKILTMSRHIIAKMLVTMNPKLLTSAQRMGSVKPLIQLIRDSSAKGLQQFEALLALTNLGAGGDDLQNKIVAEKGISSINFAVFNDHELVQQAAVECMSNLLPHEAMLVYLSEHDNMRLWLALASDHEEHYETARAACGAIAMATHDMRVAKALLGIKNFKERVDSILESGHLEIMHRMFVIMLNLAQLGGEYREAVHSHGLYTFALAYVQTYHQGAKASELEFDDKHRGLFETIVGVAKNVVRECESSS